MFMFNETSFQRVQKFKEECLANVKPSRDKRFIILWVVENLRQLQN